MMRRDISLLSLPAKCTRFNFSRVLRRFSRGGETARGGDHGESGVGLALLCEASFRGEEEGSGTGEWRFEEPPGAGRTPPEHRESGVRSSGFVVVFLFSNFEALEVFSVDASDDVYAERCDGEEYDGRREDVEIGGSLYEV